MWLKVPRFSSCSQRSMVREHAGNFAAAAENLFVVEGILRLDDARHRDLTALQAVDILRVFFRRDQFIVTSAHKLQQVIQKLADIRGTNVMFEMKVANAAAQIDPEIFLVENAEVLVHTLQKIEAVVVKGGSVHLVAAQQFAQPFPHFRGGVEGVGEGEDLVWLRMAFADKACNAIREDRSLSRAGARNYQHGTVHVFDGLALAVVDKTRSNLRAFVAAMARVAGYFARSSEVGLIQGGHHQNHPAGHLLLWSFIGISGVVPGAGLAMAVGAVPGQRGGNESHRVHEFVDGDSPEHLDILEDVFCHRRLWFRDGLSIRRSNTQQAERRHTRDNKYDSPPCQLQVASLAVRDESKAA